MNPIIYPSLLKTANKINSYSWYHLYKRKNNSHISVPKEQSIKCNYLHTIVIVPNFTDQQKIILDVWFNACISIYNLTNSYIFHNLTNNNANHFLNFINIRSSINDKIKYVCNKYSLNKHTGDYAVKHCVEMYKSAFANHKDISKFNIKNMRCDRRRKNLVVECGSICKTKNSFFSSILGDIETNIPLKNIKHNCLLQFDAYKNTYKLIVPVDEKLDICVDREKKCGIDIGVRTFLTTYSETESYEIGTNTNKIIDRSNNRLDKIKQAEASGRITNEEFIKLYMKYGDKMRNKIEDMHNKVAKFLLTRYDTIIIGNVSTKNMVSKLKGNLRKIVKRRLMILAHYRFRMKLMGMSKKYKANIIETDEYLTTKKCCKCGKINDVGKEKVYKCAKCKLIIDRDINSSINIYYDN